MEYETTMNELIESAAIDYALDNDSAGGSITDLVEKYWEAQLKEHGSVSEFDYDESSNPFEYFNGVTEEQPYV
jgi:hypothetical protein